MGKPNLKQLAEKLGLSISTVSKALRDTYDIGDETKKKVQEMAAEMSYFVNPYASHLRNNKSRTIAVLVPQLTNNFFIQAINGAESIAREKDYHLLIYVTNDDYEQEADILAHLQNGRVDGVIMSLAGNTKTYDHLNDLIQKGIPLIFFDRICHEIETVKVITDDFASGFNVTEHLIKQGCRDIAYLSYFDNLSIDNKRKQGYLEALNKYDYPINESRILRCNHDEKSNHRKIKQLFKSNPPDGIFSSVEKMAFTCYQVCGELKIPIPDKVKIASFSNLEIADLLNPSLTSIMQPAFEMGKQAAAILFKYLDKKNKQIDNEQIVIKSKLIKRGSTKRKSVQLHRKFV